MTSAATTTAPLVRHAVKQGGTSDRLSALLLLTFTLIAIAWANSPWGATYDEFWDTEVEIIVGEFAAHLTLHQLVNDGLMAFFFFTVGLEVKREFTIGELTDRRRAAVPVIAAVAGLALPAAIFLLLNANTGQAHAWGVVISTDTAFLLGALAIIGPKFPARLRTFLLTLAVVDDIGALVAIAVFYNQGLQALPLGIVAVLLVALALVRFLPVGRGPAYAVLGFGLWLAVAAAGVHPTLAGVAVALLIPVFPPRRMDVERAAELTRAFRESPNTTYARAATRSLRDSLSINERLQTAWSPYIAFIVLPIFALANAGVRLDPATLADAVVSPLTWGVIAGLVVGKFVGITGATALVRMLRIGRLAPGLTMPRIAGGAALSGIGFTIALFIVGLAIEDPETQDLARVGVLAASVIAFVLGWAIFVVGDRLRPPMAVGAKLVRPFDAERDHFRGRPDAPYHDRRVRRLRVPVLQSRDRLDRCGHRALRRRRALGLPAPAARGGAPAREGGGTGRRGGGAAGSVPRHGAHHVREPGPPHDRRPVPARARHRPRHGPLRGGPALARRGAPGRGRHARRRAHGPALDADVLHRRPPAQGSVRFGDAHRRPRAGRGLDEEEARAARAEARARAAREAGDA